MDGLGSSLPLLGIPLLFRHDRVPEQRLFSWPNPKLNNLTSFGSARTPRLAAMAEIAAGPRKVPKDAAGLDARFVERAFLSTPDEGRDRGPETRIAWGVQHT